LNMFRIWMTFAELSKLEAAMVVKTSHRGQRSSAMFLTPACSRSSLTPMTTCFGLEQKYVNVCLGAATLA